MTETRAYRLADAVAAFLPQPGCRTAPVTGLNRLPRVNQPGRWRPRAQRLAVAELDEVAVGIAHAAIVADRKGFLARRPDQATGRGGLCRHGVDGGPAFQGESEVAVVALALLAAGAAGDHHDDEVVLLAGLGQPDDAMRVLRVAALVHDPHAAELTIEGNAGTEIANVQRDMGEGRRHGARVAGVAAGCTWIVRADHRQRAAAAVG